ncbi:MAG TPA: YsnF/AvaK domain-containing protein [Terriglobales bacterium]|jgi:uncharacterized protein (TIGR02271 family)
MLNNARLAAAFFPDTGDARKAIEVLRQGGFAQIGVASRDEKRERKLAENEQVREGVAVSSDSGSQLRESMGESDYSDSGDLHGTLTTAGFSDDQAAHFEKCMAEQGGVLVSVQSPNDRWTEARRVLEAAGGDLGPVSEAAMASSRASTPRPMAATAPMSEGRRIQLRGELLRVHKDRVQSGEARIYKETITEPQTVEVPVTREELVVEHHPAAAGTPAAGPVGENQEIRVPLSEDRVTSEKVPVVTDEVDIRKRMKEGVERVADELKREKLKVEEKMDEAKTRIPGRDRAA